MAFTYLNLFVLREFLVSVLDFNMRNRFLTAKLLKQGYQYHKLRKKVQVGNDQEKAQLEKDSHSKNRSGKKTKPTLTYLYHQNIS